MPLCQVFIVSHSIYCIYCISYMSRWSCSRIIYFARVLFHLYSCAAFKENSVCFTRTLNCRKKLSSPKHSVVLIWAESHLPGALWVIDDKGQGSVFTKTSECYYYLGFISSAGRVAQEKELLHPKDQHHCPGTCWLTSALPNATAHLSPQLFLYLF